MAQLDVIVIGAGIVGSWAALHALRCGRSVAIADPSPGDGISGRNSGVLHAGLYYKTGSLKAKHCIRGKRLTEQFIEEHPIPFLRCGKLVTCGRSGSADAVDELYEKALDNGAAELEILQEPGRFFPGVLGARALHSKGTAVIDSAAYLKALHHAIETEGGVLLKGRRYVEGDPHEVTLADNAGASETMSCSMLINAAGLHSDSIALRAGLQGYEIRPVRGEYFRLRKSYPLEKLVYPLPASVMKGAKNDTALGVHYTIHPSGEIYVGPNAIAASSKEDYRITATAEEFADSLGEIIGTAAGPIFTADDLAPGYAGLRPRLFKNGEAITDFVIEESSPGFIHLLGIESPGLTAAASLVEELPFR
ncbi:NAD(P)/FAD-dependent oxidoreductase [Leptonema illini]|uniref:FAD dependent oxidoreductase n=1 Tax=Leptonema illini DSM 21528 TaxID=929563 RepID=H2CIT4_9LEPT|nr:FAD-dependent oxidoreductase [Leptonema illini]EHQ08101.1 FAD dependent oxidoreductase [Leptonema illini DSM 21528]